MAQGSDFELFWQSVETVTRKLDRTFCKILWATHFRMFSSLTSVESERDLDATCQAIEQCLVRLKKRDCEEVKEIEKELQDTIEEDFCLPFAYKLALKDICNKLSKGTNDVDEPCAVDSTGRSTSGSPCASSSAMMVDTSALQLDSTPVSSRQASPGSRPASSASSYIETYSPCTSPGSASHFSEMLNSESSNELEPEVRIEVKKEKVSSPDSSASSSSVKTRYPQRRGSVSSLEKLSMNVLNIKNFDYSRSVKMRIRKLFVRMAREYKLEPTIHVKVVSEELPKAWTVNCPIITCEAQMNVSCNLDDENNLQFNLKDAEEHIGSSHGLNLSPRNEPGKTNSPTIPKLIHETGIKTENQEYLPCPTGTLADALRSSRPVEASKPTKAEKKKPNRFKHDNVAQRLPRNENEIDGFDFIASIRLRTKRLIQRYSKRRAPEIYRMTIRTITTEFPRKWELSCPYEGCKEQMIIKCSFGPYMVFDLHYFSNHIKKRHV